MRGTDTKDELKVQFDAVARKLQRLDYLSKDIIIFQLQDTGIKYAGVKSRLKSWDSFYTKIKSKGYSKPLEECTDLLGLRIVVYLESDIDQLERQIRTVFSVNDEFSVDKRRPANSSEFGYKSLHLICTLGQSRNHLPECSEIHDLLFEVQIRTALQDTWAEIEHAFNYKSQSALPHELSRKLFSASAVLETVDASLSDVTADADRYFKSITEGEDSLNADPLTKLGLLALIEKQGRNVGVDSKLNSLEKYASNGNALSELNAFGVETLGEAEELLSAIDEKTYKDYANGKEAIAPIQFVRIAMINSDPEKYFANIDTTTLTSVSKIALDQVQARFPDLNIAQIISASGIPVEL